MKPKFFKTQLELRKWFEKNHNKTLELWIGFYKKSSAKAGVTNAEVLDVALCFGWIDGIRKSIDDESYTNRYTPRTAKSIWSKINTEHVERLTEAGLMMPAGLKAVEDAKKDGRWAKAYDPPSTSQVPEDFLKELKKNRKASAFYKTLNKQNLFTITFRLQNSKKPETRERWVKRIIEMLAKGEKLH